MDDSELRSRLKDEVTRLREMALRSTDPLITAKAVAASDATIQQRVLDRLTKDNSLVEVMAFQACQHGPKIPDIFVYFRFSPSDGRIRIVDGGFVAVVAAVEERLIGVIDPFELQPEQRIARPFVYVPPPDPTALRPVRAEEPDVREREHTYFAQLGIAHGGPASGGVCAATYVDCIGGTTTQNGDTWSDGPYCDYRDLVYG